jgi:thiamine kinase-like enzyme
MIDWEWAAPGSRRRDLGHALWQWLNVSGWGPPVDDVARLIRRALGAYGIAADTSVLADIEAREAEWLELATAGSLADSDTYDRSPSQWADTSAWVTEELAWLRAHMSRLADAIGPHG